MSRPEWREHIRQMVDDWPPVTSDTYARLALLLAPTAPPVPVTALQARAQREQLPESAAA
ncbi:hypothetical protein [Streptomyces sp. NPDC051014]|uniref:hypothetical protein n=1 Tax=Streptomyces sp. NPDC051014 TaxID=3155751 RepID=UPI0033DCFFA9